MPKLPQLTILGLLQNQWFKNPERIPRIMELYNRYEDNLHEPPRNRFIRDMLFFGCLTGRKLRKHLTEDLCNEIIWEEVSPNIGDKPSSVFPPDSVHLIERFTEIRPDVIVTFGSVARSSFDLQDVTEYLNDYKVKTIYCCHPAARPPTNVIAELTSVREKLFNLINTNQVNK